MFQDIFAIVAAIKSKDYLGALKMISKLVYDNVDQLKPGLVSTMSFDDKNVDDMAAMLEAECTLVQAQGFGDGALFQKLLPIFLQLLPKLGKLWGM